MKLATIVPNTCIDLIEDDDYFLVLSPMLKTKTAAKFYKRKSQEGAFVILDSAIIETGIAETPTVLLELANEIEADEICLPDIPLDCERSLISNYKTLCYLRDKNWKKGIMAIPQGHNESEYLKCIKEMLKWTENGITAIGISRLQISKDFNWDCRGDILTQLTVEGYDLSSYDISWHLLGSLEDMNEISVSESASPVSIRGVDSRISYFATKAGLKLINGMLKPNREFEFDDKEIDKNLYRENIEVWKNEATKRVTL